MRIKYESCPYCYSKNVKEREVKDMVVVYCGDCNNQIDTHTKETPK